MGLSPILLLIHTVTIITMLNNNGGNNGNGLNNVTCKQTLTANFSERSPTMSKHLPFTTNRTERLICIGRPALWRVYTGRDRSQDSTHSSWSQSHPRSQPRSTVTTSEHYH